MKIYTQVTTKEIPSGAQTDEISLCFDDRKRGRLKVSCANQQQVGIQIERGLVLRDATVLTDGGGSYLIIRASDEAVSTAYIDLPLLFARGSYHLGNRHVPLQLGDGFLRYQQDYVLDDMLSGLGIDVIHEQAVFEPENGAYAKAGHSHSHPSDDHDHQHSKHSHQHDH
jgi:urease accessory protein|tara:strand:- start:5511 stop:6017 length:507 start_codon:yes stop_codon:yes gene_type:complete